MFSNHFDCRNSVFQSLFSDKVNASGWKGDVGDWLRYEDLVELYSSNPNWARLEYWLYGNLMINIRDLKPWKELSFSEFCSSEGDCLLRFGDLPGRRPSLFNYYTLHLTHPRLGGLLFGNRKALYFFRSTLVHLPNNTNDSQEGESLANITVRPVITNPQIKGVQRVKNQRSHAKARERINTISGSKADGIIFADFCANCFEINMKSVVGYIQETQQIIDLKRNALGLTFTVTGNKPSIVFKEMKEKIPWVALHLDLTLPSETRVKLYYRSNLEAEFSEDNAHQVIAGPGRQICRMELPSRKGIEVIRIQPGDIPGNYILHRVIAEI